MIVTTPGHREWARVSVVLIVAVLMVSLLRAEPRAMGMYGAGGAPTRAELLVSFAGSGSGTVVPDPAGAECGPGCWAFDGEAEVTLTATPAAGSRFAGWSGDDCSGTAPCLVTMSSARAITATFIAQIELIVAQSGTGAGTISTSPEGMSCGSQCWAFDLDAAVTLTATGAGVSTFSGWTGEGCSGTADCALVLSQPRYVTATFAAEGEWVKLVEHGPFSPRDTGEGVVFQGKLWLSHGWAPTDPPLAQDLWTSTDGRSWTTVATDTPYDAYSQLVVFNEKLWAIKGSVWNSDDGVIWTQVSAQTPFGVRPYGEVVVHDGRMWQLGSGADVWSSTDGVTWMLVNAQAPYGIRYASSVIAYGGWIWLMGGSVETPNTPPEQGYPGITTFNDVWRSADGVTWIRVMEHAPWAERMWSIPAEYLGALWVIGGFDNRNWRNLNDVWYTRDGVQWEPFVAPSTFEPRHESSVYVYDGSLWVIAGNTWPVVNDVWRLTLHTAPVQSEFLRIVRTGHGSGAITQTPSGLSCGIDCVALPTGTVVTLTATPAAGSTFGGWSGACTGSESCVVTLSAATTVTATFASRQYVPMNFNNDSKADLLWHLPGGEVVVWLMDGIRKTSSVSLGSTNETWRLAGISDFNADGKSDLFWQDRTTGANVVWFMDGTTRISAAPVDSIADVNWQVVGVADFNNDGSSDLLWRHAVSGENNVWFMSGTTQTKSEALVPVADTNWRIVAVADFDRDGHPDILWRHAATGDNYVWFMNGSTRVGGKWLEAVSELKWQVVAAADYNGDGRVDLLWHNTTTSGSYVWFMEDTTRISGAYIEPLHAPKTEGIFWRHRSTGEVRVWLMDRTRLVESVGLGIVDLSWSVSGIGDFNKDGQSDILWRHTGTGDNYVWLMNGTTRVYGLWLPSEPDVLQHIVGVGDFSGDGKPDILWRHAQTGVNTVWFMDGKVRVGQATIETVADPGWTVAGVADVNRDSHLDILWRHATTGDNYVWYMDGTTRVSGQWLLQVADCGWTIGSLRDVNLDGHVDIVWRHTTTGDNYAWYMDGARRVSGEWLLPVSDVNWVIDR